MWPNYTSIPWKLKQILYSVKSNTVLLRVLIEGAFYTLECNLQNSLYFIINDNLYYVWNVLQPAAISNRINGQRKRDQIIVTFHDNAIKSIQWVKAPNQHLNSLSLILPNLNLGSKSTHKERYYYC